MNNLRFSALKLAFEAKGKSTDATFRLADQIYEYLTKQVDDDPLRLGDKPPILGNATEVEVPIDWDRLPTSID